MATRFTGIISIDVGREPRVDPERAAGARLAGK